MREDSDRDFRRGLNLGYPWLSIWRIYFKVKYVMGSEKPGGIIIRISGGRRFSKIF
jgi:hypothetical protein